MDADEKCMVRHKLAAFPGRWEVVKVADLMKNSKGGRKIAMGAHNGGEIIGRTVVLQVQGKKTGEKVVLMMLNGAPRCQILRDQIRGANA